MTPSLSPRGTVVASERVRYAHAMAIRALVQGYKPEPTPDQRADLARLAGCRRYVYNGALARRRDHHAATGTHLASSALSAELTRLKRQPATAWLAAVDSQALQQALRDLDRPNANFFAARARRPRFDSKHRRDRAARIPQRVTVDEAAGTVRLPKVGAILLRRSRPLQGVVTSATVWRLVRIPAPGGSGPGRRPGATRRRPHQRSRHRPGPDHLRHVVHGRGDSQPQASPLPAAGARPGATVPGAQEARQRESRQGPPAARAPAPEGRPEAGRLPSTNSPPTSCAASTSSAWRTATSPGWREPRTKLARPFADAAFGELLRQLRYQAAWHGKHVVAVGRCYPSSKTCSACATVYAGLTLAERVWTCAACGATYDRDANAARNLLVEGRRLFALRGAGAAAGAPAAPVARTPTTTTVAAGPPETCNACGRPVGRPPGRGAGRSGNPLLFSGGRINRIYLLIVIDLA